MEHVLNAFFELAKATALRASAVYPLTTFICTILLLAALCALVIVLGYKWRRAAQDRQERKEFLIAVSQHDLPKRIGVDNVTKMYGWLLRRRD